MGMESGTGQEVYQPGGSKETKSEIRFAENKVKEAFEKLKKSKTEDKHLHKWINRALDDLEEDAYCGIQIPKKLIPRNTQENME